MEPLPRNWPTMSYKEKRAWNALHGITPEGLIPPPAPEPLDGNPIGKGFNVPESGANAAPPPVSSIVPQALQTTSNVAQTVAPVASAISSIAAPAAAEAAKKTIETAAPAAAGAISMATPWLTAAGMGIGLVGGAFKAADEASQAKVDRADEEESMRMQKRTAAEGQQVSDAKMQDTGFNNFMSINQMALKNNRNRAFRQALATGA